MMMHLQQMWACCLQASLHRLSLLLLPSWLHRHHQQRGLQMLALHLQSLLLVPSLLPLRHQQ
jgi:hypothetical protein